MAPHLKLASAIPWLWLIRNGYNDLRGIGERKWQWPSGGQSEQPRRRFSRALTARPGPDTSRILRNNFINSRILQELRARNFPQDTSEGG